jgi:Protein of unknown function (DUF3054)
VRNKPHLLLVDVLSIVVFVAIGRDNHGEGIDASGLVRTAAPFLLGLVIGWLASSAWKRPLDAKTGAIVWLATLCLGMVFRRIVFDRGTAVAFVIVAAVFLGLSINGWRLVLRLITQRSSTSRTA